jgi:hypothetical protein
MVVSHNHPPAGHFKRSRRLGEIEHRLAEAEAAASAEPPKRLQLGIIVSRKTKETIEKLARDTGQSQGQVCEVLIEKAIYLDSLVAAMGRTMEAIRDGNIETAFRRAGYVPFNSSYGKIWVPASYPLTHRSGFIPPEPGDPGFEQSRKEKEK